MTASLIATLEARDAAILPCDVKLPPLTTIRAGCTVETLLIGLKVRASATWTGPKTFPKPEPNEKQAAFGAWRPIREFPKFKKTEIYRLALIYDGVDVGEGHISINEPFWCWSATRLSCEPTHFILLNNIPRPPPRNCKS